MSAQNPNAPIFKNPIALIFAINALDCYYMGFFNVSDNELKKLLSNLSQFSVNENVDNVRKSIQLWAEKLKIPSDPNILDCLDFESNNPELSTVMPFSEFYYRNTHIAINALRDVDFDTSKQQTDVESFKNGLLKENIYTWIDCISQIGESGLHNQIPGVNKFWLSPVNTEYKQWNAEQCRAKLGLDHLPRESTPKKPFYTTLIRFIITKDIAKQHDIKRPCLKDCPSPRFRALSYSELDKECDKPKQYGKTVDLDNNNYPDGANELVMRTKYGINKWKIEAIDGQLVGPHIDKNNHDKFISHLKNLTPNNTKICYYRNTNTKSKPTDSIEQELQKWLS